MADLRRLPAVLTAVVSVVLAAGCAGVPHSGAIYRLKPPQDDQGHAGVVQRALGPQPGWSQAEVVDHLIVAMSSQDQADTSIIQEYMTPEYGPQWSSSSTGQTVVYDGSKSKGPTPVSKNPNQQTVQITETGTIDQGLTYEQSPSSNPVPVTFTLQQQKPSGDWRVSDISVKGLLVSQDDLPDIKTPWQVYFPSIAATSARQNRLVPDTIFLPPETTPSTLLAAMLGGPSDWIEPAVYVVLAGSAHPTVVATPDPRSLVTTVDIHAQIDPHSPLTGARLETLKAQIAYTLSAPTFHTSSILLEINDVPQGGTYRLGDLPAGYDPDVLPAVAPVYYVSAQDKVIASTRVPPAAGQGIPGSSPAADSTETVLEHDDGVGQLAVGPAFELGGVETQQLAGVRPGPGSATLELASAADPRPQPWAPVKGLPPAKSFSTPSFDVAGTGLWTVLTPPSGPSVLYRIPLSFGRPGTPEAVTASTQSPALPVTGITAFKLSRDGSRAAVVANKGQAYVGVVVHPTAAAGGTWAVVGLRPIISLQDAESAVDLVWANRLHVAVVVVVKTTGAAVIYRVSSDGYTVSADGLIGPELVPGAPTSPDVQLAAGPGQLWVASVNGALTRQPATDSSTDQTSTTDTTWEPMGSASGRFPTYAG